MSESSVAHETIVLQRTYNASTTRVFAAFEDLEARAIWGAPTDGTAVVFDKTDFRIGGVDVSRCGPADSPQFLVETRYLDIVRNRRIVFAETIDRSGKRLSASLVTIDMSGHGTLTDLKVTIQLASFDRADMGGGHRAGYSATLDNLAAYLIPAAQPVGR